MLFVAGAVAAVLVTWFTFLPSFISMSRPGGPLVESTHGNLRLHHAPLSDHSSGRRVSSAWPVFFAYHVRVAEGWPGASDWKYRN